MISEILLLLGISLVIQIIFFIIAFILKTDKFTDITYSLTFILLALIILSFNTISTAKIILFIMILILGLRLGGFLFIRINKYKKDIRFDKIRNSFSKFLKFWLLQGFTVWVVLLCSLIFFSLDNVILNCISIIGLLIWIFGFLTESFADYQKFKFSLKPKNKNKFISSGLWKYSRHPNYFGEMLVWTGIYIYCISSFNLVQALIALISPLFIILLISFISGIPILEKLADKKFGKSKEYQKYKKSTSLLILWPNKKL